MPERQAATFRASTEDVQGAGSWVELRKITYGTRRRFQDGEVNALDIIADHLVAWNWVDGDGEPLPQPGDGGTLELWDDEAGAILIAIFRGPGEDDLKNLGSA
jgi:hypothetical protein